MSLVMTRSESIDLTTIITHRVTVVFILFQVRLGGYIVNSCDFYSYRIIGKLTVFCGASGVQLEQHPRQFHF
jgi:hypothetical protein